MRKKCARFVVGPGLVVSVLLAMLVLSSMRRAASSPPGVALSSPSSSYWDSFLSQIKMLSEESLFPTGIPTNVDFSIWLESETNRLIRGYGVTAVVAADGIRSIPFLSWMERIHPEWREERELAYAWISATSPFWATNQTPKWSQDEIAGFSAFFQSRFETETYWLCRMRIDDFFLRTCPDWKASDDRQVFLERSLASARTKTPRSSRGAKPSRRIL